MAELILGVGRLGIDCLGRVAGLWWTVTETEREITVDIIERTKELTIQ